ncbi:hypothetical protein GCM10009682_32870 [Luedemannella flava]|uniref:PE domain-containing protein n=2 Tax=Luedemannella flava TaxID=349316 RepID=A0ABP4Y9W3_9ACTN
MTGNIDVDLDGLRQVAKALHDAVTRDVRPAAIRIVNDCEPDIVNYGPRFATPAMTSARIRHHDSLAATLANLRSYVNTSQALVAAMNQVIAAYAASDGITAEAAKKILADAAAQADGARARYEAAIRAAGYTSVPDSYMPTDGGMA